MTRSAPSPLHTALALTLLLVASASSLSQTHGRVYRLADGAASWDLVATLDNPRFMHRLVPFGSQVLAVGGAAVDDAIVIRTGAKVIRVGRPLD